VERDEEAEGLSILVVRATIACEPTISYKLPSSNC
jgi:hypothetical protein